MEQLRYGGVLQAVEVSRAGYPIRIPHDEYLKDFRSLAVHLKHDLIALQDKPPIEKARALMQLYEERFTLSVQAQTWAVGHTLVFMKQDVHDLLSEARHGARETSALLVQSHARRRLAMKEVGNA